MHTRKRLATFFVLLAATASLGGYLAYVKLRQRPNLVVLLMDTLRADRLSCYGYHKTTSPNLDALAQKGVLFTRCYAPADYTQASTASLFTGCYPFAHGYINSNYVLEETNLTMAEIFRNQGYATAAFIANGLAGKKYRMDQGFDLHFEKNRGLAAEMVEEATAFIAQRRDQPFFIYLHFLDVHDPYRIPEPYHAKFADPEGFESNMQDTLLLETRIMQAWWSKDQKWWDGTDQPNAVKEYFADYEQLYDASIFYWDEVVGSLLKTLVERGMDQSTIIAIVSDHGEQFLEHGYFGHANSGYEEGLNIPFILFDPFNSGFSGTRIDDPVNLIDVLPTFLARLDMEIPAQVQGRERWSLIQARTRGDRTALPPGGVYTEGTFTLNRPFSTLIQTYQEGGWKLLLDRRRDAKELYHLGRDPEETRDLFVAEPGIAARLGDKLQEHYNRNFSIFARQKKTKMERQTEKLQELMALGYLAGGERLGNRRAEFFPMRQVQPTKFAPFGDEEDLRFFSDQIDFSQGRFAVGQVIRGFRDRVGRKDTAGVWFDRRATFLMQNREAKTRVVFEVSIDPRGGDENPTEIQVEFNDEPGVAFQLKGPGRYQLEAVLPPLLQGREYLYAGLRANSRFVLHRGGSPRLDVYGAMRIFSVRLED